jgi:Putative lactococcus lactis phage r1t holin
MMTREFWKGAGERAIKTFFQSLVALIGTTSLIQNVDWAVVISGSVLATLLSLATSIGNADFTAGTNAPAKRSVVTE